MINFRLIKWGIGLSLAGVLTYGTIGCQQQPTEKTANTPLPSYYAAAPQDVITDPQNKLDLLNQINRIRLFSGDLEFKDKNLQEEGLCTNRRLSNQTSGNVKGTKGSAYKSESCERTDDESTIHEYKVEEQINYHEYYNNGDTFWYGKDFDLISGNFKVIVSMKGSSTETTFSIMIDGDLVLKKGIQTTPIKIDHFSMSGSYSAIDEDKQTKQEYKVSGQVQKNTDKYFFNHESYAKKVTADKGNCVSEECQNFISF